MTLHRDRVALAPDRAQEMDRWEHCLGCNRLLRIQELCAACKTKAGCVRCGSDRLARNLAVHQDGIRCTERAVEHILLVHGWHRTGTLSRSLKKRGFVVSYVPRWIVPGGEPLVTPVSHHPEFWKRPDLEVPEPPPWPTEAVNRAIERLQALAVMLTLKGT